MSELYCEILRGSYLGLESSSKENTKWDAFFFVRLPMLIGILHQIRSSKLFFKLRLALVKVSPYAIVYR